VFDLSKSRLASYKEVHPRAHNREIIIIFCYKVLIVGLCYCSLWSTSAKVCSLWLLSSCCSLHFNQQSLLKCKFKLFYILLVFETEALVLIRSKTCTGTLALCGHVVLTDQDSVTFGFKIRRKYVTVWDLKSLQFNVCTALQKLMSTCTKPLL